MFKKKKDLLKEYCKELEIVNSHFMEYIDIVVKMVKEDRGMTTLEVHEKVLEEMKRRKRG